MIDRMEIFTTEKVSKILGLAGWRVIKFAQGQEYGIEPSLSKAEGYGSRRLYNLEDVCQIGLALLLLETGLRSKAIGKIIGQVRQKRQLSTRINEADTLYLAIFRTPEMGKPLDEQRKQRVEFVSSRLAAVRLAKPEEDVIVVPLASLFKRITEQLSKMRGGE